MALFERPSQHDIFSLLRVGFAARLRWELSDTFVNLSSKAELMRTDSRASSAVFFFISNDSLPPSHTRNASSKLTETPWPSRTMLTAVLAQPSDSSDMSYLSLSGSIPHLTDAPGLVKLSIPRGAENPHRALVALQRPGPGQAFLSLSGANGCASLAPSLSKRELFHMEILPGTVGKGFLKGPFNHTVAAFTAVQALSQVLLELGIRFRLRSRHSRVLRKDDGDGEVTAVVQNGPKTLLEETHEKELILTAYRVDGTVPRSDRYARALFVFKDVDSRKILSVAKSNLGVSRAKTLCESPAILMEGRNVRPLCVQSRNGWGVVNVGNIDIQTGEGSDAESSCQWLMAGPKGRLEMRSSPSNWESYTIEFVRQSFDMALKELPQSPVYKAASDATHAAVRAEIAAKVAKVQRKASIKPEAPKKPKKHDGFDHSAALAGLSETPKVASKGADMNIRSAPKSGQKGTASSNPQQKGVSRTGAVAIASAASTLPRNQANRKAAKRNKKKQKAKNAKRNAVATNATSPRYDQSATLGAKSASPSGSSDKTHDEDKPAVAASGDSLSSSPKGTVPSTSGPPCAACGRAMEGTYTTALGKNFHPHCFCCGKCRRPMGVGAGQFRERGGIPYCQSCYAAHLASRCARCSQPIMDTVITAMEKTWHKDCLTCTICRLPLTQTFWLYADKPNEPRCSRCVTGSEEYVGRGHGSGRMVNIPMFGRTTTPSLPNTGPATGSGASGQTGRARLMTPVLPSTTRR